MSPQLSFAVSSNVSDETFSLYTAGAYIDVSDETFSLYPAGAYIDVSDETFSLYIAGAYIDGGAAGGLQLYLGTSFVLRTFQSSQNLQTSHQLIQL